MKTISIAIFAASLISVSWGQEETKCAGEEVTLTDQQKTQITECLNEAKIKTVWKIPADKLSCFGVCILDKKGMLTPEGKINHEKAFKYIEMTMPSKVRKPLIEGIDKCIKEHGQDVKVKDDPGCMSFLHVGNCGKFVDEIS
ncbi:General odorant-binding protein 1 [Folsomia candida]|uniref:General odorant-binding protein 1 n=1 Tax=Folsomia candida TaxID=158441 RepID=A0A226EXT7_FOLCA|nr:General odorant-binding protein 1 [Folsomia candida]